MSSASIGSGAQTGARVLHQLVVPAVAAVLDVHGKRCARSRCTTTTCWIDGVSVQRLVGRLLERHDLAAAIAAVGGDEHRRLRVVDAIAQRLRR